MRRPAILLAVVFVCCSVGGSGGAAAAATIRLAQTSTVTNCMMVCNAQAALCHSNCIIPGTPPTATAVATGNANASVTCQLGCSSQQISCQTICGQTSPSP